jgi:hypothetical protein
MQGKSEEDIQKQYLSQNEEVLLSCKIEKINKFGISQSRFLLVT